jgi:hypothetical protein
MNRDWDTSFYLSVHDLDGGHVYCQADRLLEALKREHGEPRYDIPPQLEKYSAVFGGSCGTNASLRSTKGVQ